MGSFFRNNIEYETVGGIDIPLPKRPSKKEIIGYGLAKKDQKFKPTKLPDSFKKININKEGYPEYTGEQKEFITKELGRIANGAWYFINGQETYIPPYHYAELNYWKIDCGLKEYRDRDRRVHLHFWYCESDPDCYGQIYMKHRRDGATYRACCVNFFRTISHKEAHSGIQSKTGADAGGVFRKLVSSWRKLPQFLQPISEGTTNPKKSLNFSEPSERLGKNNKRVKESEALDSWIDYAPTNSEAYDGNKLIFYHGDEWGKCTESNITETWIIVKECLGLGGGRKIVGKSMITTTVAEMERKGGKHFLKLWEQSDFADKNPNNNRTTSGLYRLFISAYDGLEGFIDEYGMSMQEQAKAYLEAQRESYKKSGDQTGLEEFKRLYPFTEKEALQSANKFCEFDLEKINSRLEELTYKKFHENFDLVWENGRRDSRVIKVGNPNGHFSFVWDFERPDQSNKVDIVGEKIDLDETLGDTYSRPIYRPANNVRFCIGIDPYDHDQTIDGRGPQAGAYVFKKKDILEEDDAWDGVFVVQYLHRPKMAKIFYEDMIKLCMYFGCEMLYETQKPGIKKYFQERGYEHFLMLKIKDVDNKLKRQQGNRHVEVGQAASEKSTQQIAELTEEHVYESCYKVYFPELLEDWKVFDITNTEKHDATMAAGYTLVAATKHVKKTSTPTNITTVMPMYDYSSTWSEAIR